MTWIKANEFGEIRPVFSKNKASASSEDEENLFNLYIAASGAPTVTISNGSIEVGTVSYEPITVLQWTFLALVLEYD